ncbi:glycosyltransferase family 2 protein [Pseudovibrio brasiliensis]|uniref:Glycosyltransferase family 2 protein n=1 Tax=Pseudovibrio brasiliensis TaxID=1898042 RepID=A0ABX8B091_9HYPH|nr:glycosyltransferase family A protein [Pseudovibrio brasiliensis]QUS58916.1 glycosyltransferase family 2 protein [Pseudovibrio brasiliensis]
MSNSQRLIIAVCTRARKNMLLACMNSISQLVPHHDFEITLIICDNNSKPMTSKDQEEIKAAANVPLNYVHEVQAGIPFARNTALNTARSLNPDWIAFIDDDEILDPQWLVEMSKAMDKWPAEIYHGWTQSTPEDLNAPWSFHRPRNKRQPGTIMETAGTDNVLFSVEAVTDLNFDETMRFSGGSDIDFFYRATDRGAKIVWVPDAITREITPASRLTFGYQVRRSYSVASAQAYISRKRFGLQKASKKAILKAIGRFFGGIAGGVGSSFLFLINQRKGRKLLLSSAKKIASAIGLVRGTNMNLGQIYQKIDGS